jgi:hypothetical protein
MPNGMWDAMHTAGAGAHSPQKKRGEQKARMNHPAYTWIKSVNADSPINKVKSDKIRKCRLSLFFSF